MKNNKEKGLIALTSVIIVGGVILIMVSGIFLNSIREREMTEDMEYSTGAMYYAEKCFKMAAERIGTDSFPIEEVKITENEGGCYISLIKDIGVNKKIIISTGEYLNYVRKVQGIISNNNGKIEIEEIFYEGDDFFVFSLVSADDWTEGERSPSLYIRNRKIGIPKFDGALNFSGGYGKIEDVNLNTNNKITIMLWLKPSSDGPVVTKADTNDFDWSFYIDEDNHFGFNLDDHQCQSEDVLMEDEWNNIAITYDREDVKLYLNGDLSKICQISTFLKETSTTLTIAADLKNNQFYNGLIDEVKVYNRVLEEDEINTKMYESDTGDDSVLYFLFNEGSGSSISDSSLNENSGALLSSFSWDDSISKGVYRYYPIGIDFENIFSSKVEWEEVLPNDTNIILRISYDNGGSWSVLEKGKGIPNIEDNLVAQIFIEITIEKQNKEADSPEINSFYIQIRGN